jgi:TolA-binding protein
MEIRKLKKRLLREERIRQRRRSKAFRRLAWSLFLTALLLGCAQLYHVFAHDSTLGAAYARGEKLVEKGDYGEAARVFHSIYRHHRQSAMAPKALFQSGEILNLYLGRYSEALLAYLTVEREYPQTKWSLRAQRQEADIYKDRLRDYSRAIVVYQELVSQGVPDADRLQYRIADCYFRLNNFEQARIEFDSLLKSYPHSTLVPEATYRLAVVCGLGGDAKAASQYYRRVAHDWPASSFALEARFGLASLLESQGELERALGILEQLKGVYPKRKILETEIDQVRKRIRKKKKAV